MLPYVLEQYLKKTLSQSSSLTMVLYAYYTIERWYQENYTANMCGNIRKGSKEFFPGAIATNEPRRGPLMPSQIIQICVTTSLTP